MNLRSTVRPPFCSPSFTSFTRPPPLATPPRMLPRGNPHLSTVFLHMVPCCSLRPFAVLSHTAFAAALSSCNLVVCSHFWASFTFRSCRTHHFLRQQFVFSEPFRARLSISAFVFSQPSRTRSRCPPFRRLLRATQHTLSFSLSPHAWLLLAALFPLVVAITTAHFFSVFFPGGMGIHSQATDDSPEASSVQPQRRTTRLRTLRLSRNWNKPDDSPKYTVMQS